MDTTMSNTVKIFPFYKGECISKTETGYSSARNARQRMDDEKVRADFDKTLPNEYWFGHSYTYLLANPWNEGISPETCRNTNTYYEKFGLVYYTNGYIKSSSKTMFRELPEDVQELFRKKELISKDYNYVSGYTKDEATEYRETAYAILRKGYYPHLFRDMSDYKKKYSDFVSKNVEFREMEVEIRVY